MERELKTAKDLKIGDPVYVANYNGTIDKVFVSEIQESSPLSYEGKGRLVFVKNGELCSLFYMNKSTCVDNLLHIRRSVAVSISMKRALKRLKVEHKNIEKIMKNIIHLNQSNEN